MEYFTLLIRLDFYGLLAFAECVVSFGWSQRNDGECRRTIIRQEAKNPTEEEVEDGWQEKKSKDSKKERKNSQNFFVGFYRKMRREEKKLDHFCLALVSRLDIQ